MGFNTNKKITDADMHHIADEAAKLAGTSVTYEDEILYFATGSGGGSSGGGGSGTGYVLPVATAERLGGIKIGDGFEMESDGKANVRAKIPDEDIATDEEIQAMCEEIFGNL